MAARVLQKREPSRAKLNAIFIGVRSLGQRPQRTVNSANRRDALAVVDPSVPKFLLDPKTDGRR